MTRTIYLLDAGEQLVEMREQAYDSEDLLQRLLATHPDLLAGEQIAPATPRRWLLVSREMPVPGASGLGGRRPRGPVAVREPECATERWSAEE